MGSETTLAALNPVWGCAFSDPQSPLADTPDHPLCRYMNVILEQTEEYMNGELKNKYGDTFIRGNNVLYISAQKRRI